MGSSEYMLSENGLAVVNIALLVNTSELEAAPTHIFNCKLSWKGLPSYAAAEPSAT